MRELTTVLMGGLFCGAVWMLGYLTGSGRVYRAVFPAWKARIDAATGAEFWWESARYNAAWNAMVDHSLTLRPLRRYLRMPDDHIPAEFRLAANPNQRTR